MKNMIQSTIAIIMVSLFMVSCGGSSSTSTTPTATNNNSTNNSSNTNTTCQYGACPATGSLTFSGTGVVDIYTGTTFTAATATLTESTSPNTNYKVAFAGKESTGKGTISFTYEEATSSMGTTYSVSVNANTITGVTINAKYWTASNLGAQVTGVTIDKVNRTIALSNVTLNGTTGISSTITPAAITINGNLTY